MILVSAKINNYKSIGTTNNVLYVDNTVTALIGKNESGKSNVLEALGLINMWQPLSNDYLKKLTHGQSDPPLISLKFSFSAKDRKLFPDANDITTLTYTGTHVAIDGGLSSLISQDSNLSSCIDQLQYMVTNNSLNLDYSQITNLKKYLSKLSSVSEYIYASIFAELNSAKSIINISKEEIKTSCLELIDNIQEKIKSFYNTIPQVYYRNNDNMLKDTYSLDEIKKYMNQTEN